MTTRSAEALPWLEADAPAALERALTRFAQAERRAPAPAHVVDCTFAGAHLQLRILGRAAARALAPAFVPAATPADHPADLVVHVWDEAETGVGLPAPDPRRRLPLRIGRHFAGPGRDGPGATARAGVPIPGPLVFWEPPWVYGLDPGAGRAYFWCPDAAALPAWMRSQPLLRLLHAWCRRRHLLVAHAAAVATPSGAALLAGRGGAGKSTLALAAHLAGLLHLGDGYVAVTDQPQPRVYRLYRTAKLAQGHLESCLPEAARWLADPPESDDGKWVLRVEPGPGADGLPLHALVLPRLGGGAAAALAPVGPGHALRALAPSTLLQLPGWGAADLAALARLCRAVPAWSLGVEPRPQAAVQCLRRLLDGSAPPSDPRLVPAGVP